MKYALGVDVGGTNIRIALINEKGEIEKVHKEGTWAKSPEDFKKQLTTLYKNFDVEGYNVCGIGFGIPGPVNAKGVVEHLPNLGITNPLDLKQLLGDEINIPIYVGNDANVAALGEAIVGSGKGYNVVQYFTISTGIGGGLVVNGKIITGKNGRAQEVGSMVVVRDGRPCPSKKNGSIESECSGTALTLKGIEAGLDVSNAGDVFNLAKEGNPKAKAIKEQFIEDLSNFIGSIYDCIEPDIFVLGGGVMKAKAEFFDELVRRVDAYINVGDCIKTPVVLATYDQDCGIIGAAMLAM